jgi:hypothetical protein
MNAENIEWITCVLRKILQLFFGKWIALPDPKRTYFWCAQPPGMSREPHATRHSIHK